MKQIDEIDDIDEIDADKLTNVSVDLSKLINAVNMFSKKTV